MKDKIGIILVNYNGEKYNDECIDSIINSDYDNIEIIVIDNNSTDRSVELLEKKYKNTIRLIKNNENLGFSGANNIGINLAKSINCDYILLLNNDTVLNRDCLQIMLDISKKNINSIIAPKIKYYDKKDIIWSAGGGISWNKGNTFHYGMNEVDSGKFDIEKEVDFATGCCLLIPIDIINIVGLLEDLYFLYYEDTDFCVRVKKCGFKIIYSPKSVLYHKVSMSTGGGESPLYVYYTERNRLIFNQIFNENLFYRFLIYFFITRIIKNFKWLMTGKLKLLKASIRGIIDYCRNISGMKNIDKI